MEHCFVTGGAGFIGSSVVDRLLGMGIKVTAYDNFSTGFPSFLLEAKKNKNFTLIEGDMLTQKDLNDGVKGCDFVFHLAANADVRHGTEHPQKDLQQNTIATFNLLEAMRLNDVKKIAFSSTGSVYGEHTQFPTPEEASFPIQTSLYGASKLSGESLISAYCEGFGLQGYIFRFVSVLGERYTHGHVFDFYKNLLENPHKLRILGDGTQRKSYMYIQDCIDGMLLAIQKGKHKVCIYNLGQNNYINVNQSVAWITEYFGLNPLLEYTGGSRGWIGDNPFIFLCTKRICSLGWTPQMSIKDSVIKTVQWLEKNSHVFYERK